MQVRFDSGCSIAIKNTILFWSVNNMPSDCPCLCQLLWWHTFKFHLKDSVFALSNISQGQVIRISFKSRQETKNVVISIDKILRKIDFIYKNCSIIHSHWSNSFWSNLWTLTLWDLSDFNGQWGVMWQSRTGRIHCLKFQWKLLTINKGYWAN